MGNLGNDGPDRGGGPWSSHSCPPSSNPANFAQVLGPLDPITPGMDGPQERAARARLRFHSASVGFHPAGERPDPLAVALARRTSDHDRHRRADPGSPSSRADCLSLTSNAGFSLPMYSKKWSANSLRDLNSRSFGVALTTIILSSSTITTPVVPLSGKPNKRLCIRRGGRSACPTNEGGISM